MFAIVSGMKLTKTKSKEKSFPRGEKKRVVSLMILRIFMFDKVSVFSKVVMKLTKTKSKEIISSKQFLVSHKIGRDWRLFNEIEKQEILVETKMQLMNP